MRLVIKAHKYLKRWRGSKGDWQYKYPKEKVKRGPVIQEKLVEKKDPLHQEKGAFAFAVKPKTFYTKATENEAKIKVPNQYVYAAFKKFNRTFVIHRRMMDEKILGETLRVTDVLTGKALMSTASNDPEAVLQDAIQTLDRYGFRKVQKYLGTQDVKDMSDYLHKAHTRHDAAILWLQNAIGELGVREHLEEWAKGHMINLEELGGDTEKWEKEVVYGDATPTSDIGEIITAAVHQDKHPNDVYEEGMAYRGKEADLNVLAEQLKPDAPAYNPGKGVYYDLPLKRAEKAMKRGRVIGQKVLGGGINATYRLQLEDGDGAEAVWKPEAGELHFFQPGLLTRPKIPRDWYKRESAVYELDKMLGFDLVPPTVIREVSGEVGSLQFFKQGAVNATTVFPWDQHCSVEDRQKAMVLDFLCYNQDRHTRNFMIGPDEELILIDNGLSFPVEEDQYYYTQFRHSANINGFIPSSIIAKMEKIDPGKIASKLRRIRLEDNAIQGFLDRWDRALEGSIPRGHPWRQTEGAETRKRQMEKVAYWESHRTEIERLQKEADPNFDFTKELAKLKGPARIGAITGSAFWEKR